MQERYSLGTDIPCCERVRGITEYSSSERLHRAISSEFNFQIHIVPPPQEGHARQPILSSYSIAAARRLLIIRQDPSLRFEFRSHDFSAYRAGRNPHSGIVPDSFDFSRIRPGHYVKFLLILAKPDRRCNRRASFTNSGERNILLPANRIRYRFHHAQILRLAAIRRSRE